MNLSKWCWYTHVTAQPNCLFVQVQNLKVYCHVHLDRFNLHHVELCTTILLSVSCPMHVQIREQRIYTTKHSIKLLIMTEVLDRHTLLVMLNCYRLHTYCFSFMHFLSHSPNCKIPPVAARNSLWLTCSSLHEKCTQ